MKTPYITYKLTWNNRSEIITFNKHLGWQVGDCPLPSRLVKNWIGLKSSGIARPNVKITIEYKERTPDLTDKVKVWIAWLRDNNQKQNDNVTWKSDDSSTFSIWGSYIEANRGNEDFHNYKIKCFKTDPFFWRVSLEGKSFLDIADYLSSVLENKGSVKNVHK